MTLLTEQTRHLDLARVEQFASGLEEALYDISVEATSRHIVFLFDADVTIATILGATTSSDADPEFEPHDPVVAVRSLLGAGVFGPIRMLRAHLVEFERVINSLPRPGGRLPRGYFDAQRERLRNLYGFVDLESWLTGLRDRVSSATDDVSAEEFVRDELIKFLDKQGFITFILAELCFGGAWFNRLASLINRGVLLVEPIALDDRFDLRGARFDAILETINAERGATDRVISNMVDATALVALERMGKNALDVEYRFYSETPAVRKAVLKNDIGAPLPVLGDTSGPRSLLRTEMYFLIRASFPALRVPGTYMEPHAAPSAADLSFGNLRALSENLRKIVNALRPDDDIEQILANYSLQDTPLNVLLSDCFQMSFVWRYVRRTRYSADALQQLAPALVAALQNRSLATSADTELRQQLHLLRKQIDDQLGALSRWKLVIEHLRRAVGRQLKYVGEAREERRDDGLPSIDYDLGLIRWGLDKLVTTGDQLRSFMAGVQPGDGDEIVHCGHLANLIVQDSLDDKETEFTLLTLWWLREWNQLIDFWGVHVVRKPRYDIEFRPLLLVARARKLFEDADRLDSLPAFLNTIADLVAQTENYREYTASAASRGYRDMCVAHVGYWCWQILKKLHRRHETSAGSEDTQAILAHLHRIAENSFAAGESAIKHLSPNAPARVFAINHCAYLGTIARIREPETRTYLRQLIEETTAHRNFRIADTLAKPYSMKADDIIAKYGLSAVRENAELRDAVITNLKLARRYLYEGQPFFGDDEATKHLAQVQQTLNEMDAADGAYRRL